MGLAWRNAECVGCGHTFRMAGGTRHCFSVGCTWVICPKCARVFDHRKKRK